MGMNTPLVEVANELSQEDNSEKVLEKEKLPKVEGYDYSYKCSRCGVLYGSDSKNDNGVCVVCARKNKKKKDKENDKSDSKKLKKRDKNLKNG
jgi:DNA-directed RNA polymerase subunit RPC12/RpoP